METRRFFVETSNLTGSTALISGPDARHIKTVLRLKPGDEIALFDGTGVVYSARITLFLEKQVKVDLLGKCPFTAESPVDITVAQAYLKDNKMDMLVRQLTELGITAWRPFISRRSIPKPDNKRLEGRRQRWQKIAQESLKQCRRGRVPQIGPMENYEAVLERAQTSDLKIIFWESEKQPLQSLVETPQPGRIVRDIFLIMGPEGGFATQEVQQAEACGFQSISLGPRILKAETATVTACALIQYLFGDLGQKNLDKQKGF
ncbi:MAG: 16S rRNA (uracil(1498)-N(3))-methyltransferase [Desulfobacterales bacterium]|nr:16S rRNA (uracil(1498)-N(3))-methyltransferase [Desulfobacterales bacterium]